MKKTGVTEASGNVVFIAGKLTVKTDHLVYDKPQQKAMANGRVEITQGSTVTTTASGRVEVNLKNGEFKLIGTTERSE